MEAVWDKCPGQNTQFWKPDDIFDVECPTCGGRVEFWKDELRRKCKKCKTELTNPKHDLGCAAWCEHADKCFGAKAGDDGSNDLKTARMKPRLIAEMKKTFGTDARRVTHALRVMDYAESIMKEEKGSNALVVFASALLHDIGIQEAERKHNSNAPEFQQIEGPPIALEIMERLRIEHDAIDEVCEIIAHHHEPGAVDSVNFKILLDADRILYIMEEHKAADVTDEYLAKNFFTETGRRIARETFVK